jgi:hypothetical protein
VLVTGYVSVRFLRIALRRLEGVLIRTGGAERAAPRRTRKNVTTLIRHGGHVGAGRQEHGVALAVLLPVAWTGVWVGHRVHIRAATLARTGSAVIFVSGAALIIRTV